MTGLAATTARDDDDPAGVAGMRPTSDNLPSCLSCHKTERDGNPFGLLYMAGQGQLTENGDSQGKAYVDLCHQCHTQGLTSPS